jgi:hypothetical protein
MFRNLKNTGVFFICIAFLMGAALYNGYPLVTSDTGTYINSAFTLEVARDRPFGYSLLIALSSLSFSLWLTVICQCVILYFLMRRLSKLVIGRKSNAIWSQILLFASCSALTGVSWYAGMIMPDLFIAVGGLAFLLFVLDESLRMRVIYAILLVFSISTHTSHLLIFSILSLVLLLYFYWFQKDHLKRGLMLTGICMSCWLIVPLMHFSVDRSFQVNKSTHVFLTGRFLETGTLQRYLRKECESNPIGLCNYKDNLPKNAIEFIWNDQSPLYKTNGWDDSEHEYRKMTRDILTTPKYCFQFLYSSFFSSLSQLIQTDVGDGLTPHIAESNPYWKIVQYYKYELPTYLNSLQNTSRLKYSRSNNRYQWVVILSLLYLSWLYFGQKRIQLSSEDKLMLFIILSLVIANAFVTATFGNVLARLQSRVVWLIPLMGILFGLKYHLPIKWESNLIQ